MISMWEFNDENLHCKIISYILKKITFIMIVSEVILMITIGYVLFTSETGKYDFLLRDICSITGSMIISFTLLIHSGAGKIIKKVSECEMNGNS